MKDKNTRDDSEPESMPFTGIYRHGHWYERVATVIGVVLGLCSSVGVGYNLLQFGEISTAFVERTSFQQYPSSRLPLLSIFGGGRRLNNASNEENMAALMEDAGAFGIGMAISIGVSMLLCVLSVAFINWSALRMITRIRFMYLEAVLRQDQKWFDTDTSFNLASRMSDDMFKLKEGMGEKLSVVSNLLGTAVFCFCVAFPLGWELTLVCMIVVPFSIASAYSLTNYQTRSSATEMEGYSRAGKHAEEVLRSIRTVVAYAGEHKETERYRKLLVPAERCGRRRGLLTGLGTGFNWLLTYSLNAIGLAYGTRLVVADLALPVDDRRYIVGNIFSILFCVYMGTQSITLSIPHGETFSAARAAAAGIFRLMDRVPDIDSLTEEGLRPRRVAGDIILENVDFSYPSRPTVQVLKNFSLHIRAGESVALVGSSGCGKSTILQLVQRMYDPNSGSVKLDGRDIKTLNIGWLRSCFGVVGQEPVLFRGTIKENIAIGIPEATMQDIQKAAENAYAHEFISRLPEGYNTMIGERGGTLSGGQKQRIAIARSLLRSPAVLLLDEATSALDPASERQVQTALDSVARGLTTLTVSHRLSTILNADRIICMDQGAIMEEGTHDELISKKGFYWKLVNTGGHATFEPDVIDTLREEADNQESEEVVTPTRNEVKRRSIRRVSRSISVKRRSADWMTPRSSIASAMSFGFQNFGFISDDDEDATKDEKDSEKVKSLSHWEMMKLNKPEWPLIIIGSIAAFIQGACFPAFSLIFGNTIGIFSSPDHEYIIQQSVYFALMFVAVAAVAGVSMALQGATFTSSGLKMTTRLRVLYFSSLLRQDMSYHDDASNTVGASCSRLSSDVSEVQGGTGLRIGIILQGVSSVVIGFLMAISYNWKLTLVGTVFLPLMVGSIWLEGVVARKSQEQERKSMEESTSIATEAVSSIQTVHSLGIERVFTKKMACALSVGVRALIRKTRLRGLVLGMGLYVPFLAFSCAMVYGISLVAYEGEEYAVVLLVTQAIMYGAYMLGHALVYAPNFKSAQTCAGRIIATVEAEPRVRDEPSLKDRKDWVCSGAVSLKQVEFSYSGRGAEGVRRVLRGFDLQANPGQTVALVGASGCGKSTVLQLLQRFYDPDVGTVELDEKDIRMEMSMAHLRRQLGVVQQEPVLFERSVAENIAYGDNARRVSAHEVVAAAKAANIHAFIASLPQGYDTSLGAGGAALSGGQRQRVCIARALLRQPRLLLLDEATSALDAASEKAVTEALEKAAEGRTCITIAHRLSTIRDVDLICVVHKGKIVERGTHTELMELRGHYYQLSRGQQLGA